ncbi:MAG: gamma-glutamyl-gamma-aminobutyrate hydrolase family protein [Halanaerobiales bacterium]
MHTFVGLTLGYRDSQYRKLETTDRYSRAVKNAGGVPLLLPPLLKQNDICSLLSHLDGILLTGGVDIDPRYFSRPVKQKNGRIDPLRDKMEIILVRQALEKNIPILAICRGIQVLNSACGGTLYQDLPPFSYQHLQKAPKWYPVHKINIKPGSVLHKLYSTRQIGVNSFHHQSVKDPGENIKILARAEDGVIEALKIKNHPFALGVQWHPEEMLNKYSLQKKLFQYFLGKANKYAGR